MPQAPQPVNALGILPWQTAMSQGMGSLGGGGSLGQASPSPIFANQIAQSPFGGFGSAYTIDVLNALRPLGVQANQYPQGPMPRPPGPQAPSPTSGGNLFDSLSPAQRLALAGLGGSPRNSGATFAGPDANMLAPASWFNTGTLGAIRQAMGLHPQGGGSWSQWIGNALGS